MDDAIIIGGGPGGLQAALTLGRVHRSAVLVDSGEYRNAAAGHVHNLLGRDGTPPAELRAAALEQLRAYPTVRRIESAAATLTPVDGGFRVTLDSGEELFGQRVVLATGVRDRIPDLPGLAQLWGSVAVHCPYCHGHELAGRVVAVDGDEHGAEVAAIMSRIAGEVLAIDPSPAAMPVLERTGARVVRAAVREVKPDGDGARLYLDDDTDLRVDAWFVSPSFSADQPVLAGLDLDQLSSGCVEIDQFCRTSVPGVYAAGDMAHQPTLPMPFDSVLHAAAAGLTAAVTVHQDLLAQEFGTTPP